MTYVFLAIAILGEVIATSALKATEEFSRLWPSLIVVTGYCVAFYFLTLTLRTLPVGITYAIWSGVGVVLVTVAGIILYKEMIDFWAWLGIGFIIVGVLMINVLSKSVSH